MTRRMFVLLCCVLLAATSMLAQSRGAKTAKTDPLSGTWTGELAPSNDTRRASVTLELKFDGKSAVTGTITGMPNPGDVKTGTFDPKTGALKLQLGRTDGPEVLLILEGTVVKGSASGRVTGDIGTGEFKLTKKA